MSFLPDEIWNKILEMGARAKSLSCRDLCSLAITCHRFNRLSSDPCIWSILLTLDFRQSVSSSSSSSSTIAMPSKSLYRTWFERDKARRVAAFRRAILYAESRISVCRGRLDELECQLRMEGERMKAALEELNNLERVRQASIALNVWQPEVVRGSQRQTVEQCTVPIQSRLHSLYMESRLCKLQIAAYKNAHNKEKQRLEEFEEAFSSLKYKPLETFEIDYGIVKKKKLKRNSSLDQLKISINSITDDT